MAFCSSLVPGLELPAVDFPRRTSCGCKAIMGAYSCFKRSSCSAISCMFRRYRLLNRVIVTPALIKKATLFPMGIWVCLLYYIEIGA